MNAIHGLTRWLRWKAEEVEESRVVLRCDLPPQPGYPFWLELQAEHRLDAGGLSVHVTATNTGDQPCPYGAGAHPYLAVAGGGLIDDLVLATSARATLVTDERAIPTGEIRDVGGTELDFRTPRPIRAAQLDTAFTQLQPDNDGVTRVSVRDPRAGRTVTVWMDGQHSFLMLYTGDTLVDEGRRRHGLGVEPMTCAPDAFNNGMGLRTLQPGERHDSSWGVSVAAG